MNDFVMRHTDSTHPIVVTFNVGSATIKMAAYDTAKAVDSSPLAWSPLFDVNINLKPKTKSGTPCHNLCLTGNPKRA